MTIVLTVLLAFVASVLATHLYIRLADWRKVVAKANHRSMHKGETVTGGGVAVLVSAIAVFLGLWPLGEVHYYLLPAAAVLAMVSFLDDLQAPDSTKKERNSQKLRFAFHIAAAIAAVASVHYTQLIFQGWLPFWADRAFAVFALVWFINLFNFMDGIDGIAGIETVTIAGGFAVVTTAAGMSSPLFGLALAIAGAAAGFLFWNWHPARVFMGDVGSVPLGFLCGALMIWLAVKLSLSAALILPLYFVADATITIIKRLLRGEDIREAHRSHYYQRSARGVRSHAIVVRRVAVCNAVLIGLAVLALTMPVTAFALAGMSVAGLLTWMEFAAAKEVANEAGAQ